MTRVPFPEGSRKNDIPFLHYLGIYKTLDPADIALRCSLAFNGTAFELRFAGNEYRAAFPNFELKDSAGETVQNPAENILLLRYLCEGKYLPPGGRQLSYQEIPWGTVYYSNFRGRCISRFASFFGKEPAAFRRVMEETTALRAAALKQGDAGYRFEAVTGLFMSVILWSGDDEFTPSAQILFDDNFVCAFTAEDLAVLGELVFERLRNLKKALDGQKQA